MMIRKEGEGGREKDSFPRRILDTSVNEKERSRAFSRDLFISHALLSGASHYHVLRYRAGRRIVVYLFARARERCTEAESQYEVRVAFSCRLVSQEFNADRR